MGGSWGFCFFVFKKKDVGCCLSTMTDVIFGLLEETLLEPAQNFPARPERAAGLRECPTRTSLGEISSGAGEVKLLCCGDVGFKVARS